tara:strand:- start:77 stop:1222 length:1146 start_codon:yes stop_codon:yes gene_type:complete
MKKKYGLKNSFIPVNTPRIYNDEKSYVLKCLSSGWLSSEGEYVKKFENKFAKYNKKKYGVSVSNGSAALEIALKSLNLKKGSEIIIPTFSIISTALCVVKLGLKPILIDCDLKSWNMKENDVLKKINKRTRAIIITHIYGFPFNMTKVLKVAKMKKIKIIEDAAEVIGLKFKGRPCGSFGDLSTFSFYANKHITTGEGGMIITNDKKLYEKCSSLRNLCFGKGIDRFNHTDLGWNYRFTNIQAAIGLGQLKNINWAIKRKKEIGRLYFKKLKNNKNIYIQNPKNVNGDNIYWVFGILIINFTKFKRDKVVKKLLKFNIQTRNFFHPMHKQKVFLKMNVFKNKLKYPNSEFISKNGFYLPSGLAISNKEILYICKIVNKIIN